MSLFALKILALLAMTIDHIGLVFGWQGWDLLPFSSRILRTIGRVSFPLFAFCLARGWHTTRNRKRYFQNLLLGAVVSQMPFTMAFYAPNLTVACPKDSLFRFEAEYGIFAAVAVGTYWGLILQRRWENSILAVGAATILPGIRLRVHGIWLLCENSSVFYTFLMAFVCLYALQKKYAFPSVRRIWLLLAVPILWVGYGLPADYGTGLVGIALIVGLSELSTRRQQALFLVGWSLLYYGGLVGDLYSAASCMVACIFILLYDPNIPNRFRAKRFFYWYYPTHLLLLGIINVGMRFLR